MARANCSNEIQRVSEWALRNTEKARTRRVCAAAMAIGILWTIGGCAAPDNTPSITIVLAENPWQRAIEPLIPEFEDEYGVEVDVQVLAEQQARDRILLNLQSHSTAMDVFMTLPSREGPQFDAAGWYGSLEDLLSDPELDVDDFTPASMQAMSVDGEPVALPVNVEATALYYRADVFQRLGLEPPSTIDQVIEAAEAIAAEGEIVPFTSRGLAAALPFTFSSFLHSEGGEWTEVDSTQAVQAISDYARLMGEYGPLGVLNNSFPQNSLLVAQGEVAMNIDSTNELASMIGESSRVNETLTITHFPAGEAGSRPTVVSWGLAVSAYAAGESDATNFIHWATSSEMQSRLAVAGIAPPRASAFGSPEFQGAASSEIEHQWLNVLQQAQQNGSVEVGPVGENAPEMRRMIGDAIGRAILGDATAVEAANEMQQKLASLMSG